MRILASSWRVMINQNTITHVWDVEFLSGLHDDSTHVHIGNKLTDDCGQDDF
jgi:hypothetical protein